MSVAVELERLQERIDEYGAVAFVVTVGDDGRPHVVSSAVTFSDDAVTAGSGRTTSTNAGQHPDVTLVWPQRPGDDYCLIVDGIATVGDGSISVAPVRAVLHRVAGAPEEKPSCVTVLDQRKPS